MISEHASRLAALGGVDAGMCEAVNVMAVSTVRMAARVSGSG